MAQKILIAFDNSENAMRAVQYVAQCFPAENSVTLFHVFSDTAVLCEMHSPELAEYFVAQQSNFCALEEKKRQLVKEAMGKAKESLLDAGFAEKNILFKFETKKKGIARDILKEAEDGYHLVVIGRRGLSAIAEFFIGSVSQKVSHSAKHAAVLIVN
jgi:nucleotide-binding universal stress UspA family protein